MRATVWRGLGLFALMGGGTLFPYNSIVTCVDWFEHLYPEVVANGVGETGSIAVKLATVSIVSLLITTILLLPLTQIDEDSDEGTPIRDAPLVTDMDGHVMDNRGMADHHSRRRHGEAQTNLVDGQVQRRLTQIMRNWLLTFSDPKRRIAIGFTIEIFLLLVFALVEPSMIAALVLAFLVGAGDAVSQSGLYAYASSVDARCAAASSFGSAAAGVVASSLRLITKAIFSSELSNDAGARADSASFFVLSSMFLGCCLLGLRSMGRMEEDIRHTFSNEGRRNLVATQHASRGGEEKGAEVEITPNKLTDGLVTSKVEVTETGKKQYGTEIAAFQMTELIRKSPNDDPRAIPTDTSNSSFEEIVFRGDCVGCGWLKLYHLPSEDDKEQPREVLPTPKYCHFPTSDDLGRSNFFPGHYVYNQTFRVAWKPIAFTFFNSFVTLSLFPGTVTSIRSSSSEGSSSADAWLQVILIAIFNLFDCFGRGIPAASDRVASRLRCRRGSYIYACNCGVDGRRIVLGHDLVCFDRIVGFPCASRVVFFPLLYFCVSPVRGKAFIRPDWVRCAIVSAFALTNGFVNAACFISGPAMLEEAKHRDAASLLLLLAGFLGLTAGGSFAVALDSLPSSRVQ